MVAQCVGALIMCDRVHIIKKNRSLEILTQNHVKDLVKSFGAINIHKHNKNNILLNLFFEIKKIFDDHSLFLNSFFTV